jgi:hypothetical protein
VINDFHRYFRYHRENAFTRICWQLSKAPSEARIWPTSLALGAIVIYMHNALMYRQGENDLDKILTKAACQHIVDDDGDADSDEDADEETTTTVPIMYNRGLFFVSDVVTDRAFRLPQGRIPSKDVICAIYKSATMACIEEKFQMVVLKRKRGGGAHPERTANKRGKTMDVQYIAGQCMLPHGGTRQPMKLAEAGVKIRKALQMSGEDVALDHDNGCHSDNEMTVDQVVEQILYQFPYDLMQISPNFKSRRKGAQTLLTRGQREGVTANVFKSFDFSQVFARFQYCVVDEDKWYNHVFGHLFPAKGERPPENAQNYHTATYFRRWVTNVMNRQSPHSADITRKKVYKEFFKELRWVPYPHSHRIWDTKVMDTRSWVYVPKGVTKTATVQLAFNARFWWKERATLSVGPTVEELRQEEEESSIDEENE